MDQNIERERRQFQRTREAAMIFYRIKSPIEVILQFSANEFNGIAADLSQDGIGIITSQEIPKGTILAVRFMLFDVKSTSPQERTKSIEILGEVMYIKWVLKEKGYRVGVHFTHLTEQDKAFISLFVKSRESNA